jgi:hypothetical protein
MPKNYQLLIKNILVGTIASDGGVATVFASLGYTRKDTLVYNTTAPTFQPIEAEEIDTPALNVKTASEKVQIQWNIFQWDVDVLTSIWGGTVVDGQWQAPDASPTVEKSLRIEPRDGKPFIYPRVQLTAQVQYDTTGKIFQIAMSADVLQPLKAGTPSWMWGDPDPE